MLQVSVDRVLRLPADGVLANISSKYQPRFETDEVCRLAERMVAAGQLRPLALWVARLLIDGQVEAPRLARDQIPPLPVEQLQDEV
ncbi:hypothetical protein [Capillimicrobium parvum]|uniref:Uncharacterized protein n=1 Tax=Capillimicrobium parvum TaxID=2884022 RepID=A0A9E6XUH4_9ACTN|nr:hypothetical protein [Capillimicrobium parvum]UGS34700.1 hypothetical protein DSM104329_01082 [Capillimicrobium parvum]